MTKIRLLADQFIEGVPVAANAVIDLSDDLVAGIVEHGLGDPDAEAVAYAETLGVEVPPGIDHPDGGVGEGEGEGGARRRSAPETYAGRRDAGEPGETQPEHEQRAGRTHDAPKRR
jgi:hypothetical protein